MIGVYDYTVILTYMSLLSAGVGIFLTFSGNGHPFLGILCLMISGLFDGCDGKVASLKKNRTKMEKSFGIQIDSLADLVAFGVLPACIGYSLLENSSFFQDFFTISWYGRIIHYILWMILILYVLAALIRLAYYNVIEEEKRSQTQSSYATFTGFPVTSSVFIFPTVLLISKLSSIDGTLIYLVAMFLTSFAFLIKFHIKKPKLRDLVIMIVLGVIEFLWILYFVIF